MALSFRGRRQVVNGQFNPLTDGEAREKALLHVSAVTAPRQNGIIIPFYYLLIYYIMLTCKIFIFNIADLLRYQ
jgi:hypothetical protein